MDHLDIIADIIKLHREKYNERRRVYRAMRKNIDEGTWFKMCRSNGWHCSEYSLQNSNPRSMHAMSCLDSKNLAEYRKWCRLASQWRRLGRECKALLDAMRVIGKMYGTKVQTSSDSGYSFNKPFYIHMGESKVPIKRFLEDQIFEQIIFGEDDADEKN